MYLIFIYGSSDFKSSFKEHCIFFNSGFSKDTQRVNNFKLLSSSRKSLFILEIKSLNCVTYFINVLIGSSVHVCRFNLSSTIFFTFGKSFIQQSNYSNNFFNKAKLVIVFPSKISFNEFRFRNIGSFVNFRLIKVSFTPFNTEGKFSKIPLAISSNKG